MNHKTTRTFTHQVGVFFAAMFITGALFMAGCSNAPDNTVQEKADRALAAFVKLKFEKLSISDFKPTGTKRNADDSWEFAYESEAKTDLPRFRLFLTITPDGRELWKAQKENDPTKPPVGAEALRAERLKKR